MKKNIKRITSCILFMCILMSGFNFCKTVNAEVDTSASGIIAPPSADILNEYATGGIKTITDANNNCLLLTVQNTSGAEWNTYRTLLMSKGYAEIVGKTAVSGSTNKWALYANDQYLINCFYSSVSKLSKITIEPRDVSIDVFKKPSSVDYVCEPMLIQMGLDDNTSTSQIDIERSGMGYILRLADGRFIVYDGGFEGTNVRNADKIYNIMKKYAATSGAYANQVVIAAWVITHPHGDHIGAFMNFVKYYIGYEGAGATLQSVICNIPSLSDNAADTNAILGYGVDLTTTKLDRYNKTLLALEEIGVDVYKAHTGQKYYFNEADIEILFTAEHFLPTQITTNSADVHGTNSLSIVSRVTWNCPAYAYTALFTADANYYSIREINKLYGANLATGNFVQTPHHGCVSEYKEGTPLAELTTFYNYVNAHRTLMPSGVRYGYVNQGKTTTPLYDDEARLIGYAQRAGNPTPSLPRTFIAGSSVSEFTLMYNEKKVVPVIHAGADFFGKAPTLESTTVAAKEGSVYLIYNEMGMSDLKASRSYKLLKDITITNIPGETQFPLLGAEFYGNLNGNGHKLIVRSSASIKLAIVSGDSAQGLLFTSIGTVKTDANGVMTDDQGTIKNLDIYAPYIAVNGNVGGQFGVIAAKTSGYSVIKNVNIVTKTINKKSTSNANFGSMVGKAMNGIQIIDSSYTGKIYSAIMDGTHFTSGGLIGCVEMKVNDASTTNDDSLNRTVVINNCTVNQNDSEKYVFGYTNGGGLIGLIKTNPATVTISNSAVYSGVKANDFAGGAIGKIGTAATVTIDGFTNYANISGNTANEFVGYSNTSGVVLNISNCSNRGIVNGVASVIDLTPKANTGVRVENGVVYGIGEKLTLDDVKALFESSDSLKANSEHIGTGTILSYNDKDYKVVVLGDTDGDGQITSTDYLRVKSAFLDAYNLKNEFFTAADCDSDGEITTTDYLKIKNRFMGTQTTDE